MYTFTFINFLSQILYVFAVAPERNKYATKTEQIHAQSLSYKNPKMKVSPEL